MTNFDVSPTGLTCSSSLEHWNRALRSFLSHGSRTADHLTEVMNLSPNFALGHAFRGLSFLLLGRRELYDSARLCHTEATRCVRDFGPPPRERIFVEALGSWLDGYPTRSVTLLELLLSASPEDSLAMKMSHAIRFVLGDGEGMRRSLERVASAYSDDHPARGYFLGCLAFALEETGDYALAEKHGKEGVDLAPDDAWGLHAVTHVYDMTANSRAGLEWMTGREGSWTHCNNFRYHVWWHKALLHLDLGEIDAVFSLYDSEIRRDKTDDYRDISNATSLLGRLELNGIDVGDRWEELADLSSRRTDDGCLVFADLHYLLALTGDNRTDSAVRLVSRIRRDATSDLTDSGVRMSSPGVCAAVGLHAFGDGDYQTAFHNLRQARSTIQLAGGSHAQRDIFERLTIDSGIRSGLWDESEKVLDERRIRRGGHDDNYSLARMSLIASGRDADRSVILESSESLTIPAE